MADDSNPILDTLREQGKKARLTAASTDNFVALAKILQDKYGVDFSDAKSVNALVAKLAVSNDVNSRPGVDNIKSQDKNGLQNILELLVTGKTSASNQIDFGQIAADPGSLPLYNLIKNLR